MFAIYGVSGQMFRGPLEEMRKVAPTLSSARVRAIDPDRDRPEAQQAAPVPDPQATGAQARHQQALSEYARVQSPVEPRHPLSRVGDVMTREVVVLADTTQVQEAWALLAQQGVGQAPVVNAQGALVGLLTRADLLQADKLPGPETNALVWRALMVQPVTELMFTPVPSVDEETDIRRVAQVLLDSGLPGLPVVEADGRVSGFVSRSDILRAVVHDPPLDLWS